MLLLPTEPGPEEAEWYEERLQGECAELATLGVLVFGGGLKGKEAEDELAAPEGLLKGLLKGLLVLFGGEEARDCACCCCCC